MSVGRWVSRRMSAAQLTASVVVPVPPLVPRKLTIMPALEATRVPAREKMRAPLIVGPFCTNELRRDDCTFVSRGHTNWWSARAGRGVRREWPATAKSMSRAGFRRLPAGSAGRGMSLALRVGVPLSTTGNLMATSPPRSPARPAHDEWGVYDPQQAGLAALFARSIRKMRKPRRTSAAARSPPSRPPVDCATAGPSLARSSLEGAS